MFHVKQLVLMLDVRVRAGEYEALAPCLLEETIMRGRRRGRNRPSPPGSASAGSAEAAASDGKGAVKLLDSTDSEESSERSISPDESVDRVEETVSDTPSPDAPESSSGAGRVDSPDSPTEPEESGSPSDQEPSDTGASVDSEPVAQASAAPSSGGAPEQIDDVMPEKSKKEPSPPATGDEATAAPVGRQPQAASGNPLPRVLAVANQKGGVGKTTTSVNLGAALAELGFRVLVIDLDPQGNATTGLGIDARNFELSMYDVLMRDSSLEDCVEPTSMKNLFVAPATIALAGAEIELVPAFSRELKLKRAIESVIDDFDFVLIDCPPSLGLITVNALAAADEVLVPIQCEYYALEGLSQLMRNVHLVASNLNPRLDISTIVLTMYDARTKLADQVATEVREHFGNKVCRIVIPRTVRLSEAPSFGQPITAFDPASRGAIAYRELAKEVSGGTS